MQKLRLPHKVHVYRTTVHDTKEKQTERERERENQKSTHTTTSLKLPFIIQELHNASMFDGSDQITN